MLNLREQHELETDIEAFAGFTEDDIERAELFDIDYNPITELTTVTLYDEHEAPIRSVHVEDYDAAIAIMEEIFDIDDDEISVYDYRVED